MTLGWITCLPRAEASPVEQARVFQASPREIPVALYDTLVFSDTVNYRGMMFTGIPNLLWVFGYFRGSWTVRADLLSDFVCRLLTHMDDKDAQRVEVKLRPEDEDMELLPWQDPENFNPGYLTRAMPLLPKSGAKPEWHHSQNLAEDLKVIPGIDLDGEEFVWG